MMKPLNAVAALALGLSLAAPAGAQQRRAPDPRGAGRPDNTSLAVINNPAPQSQTGEVSVQVRGDENPIVRLQMVAGGQALVEFPARDRIFKVNPADPDLVTIEDSPTKESDRYILLRSGKQFLAGAAGTRDASAATSVLVQMTSGMVITLLVYPVRDIGQVVHRCVVKYDREAVLRARQAAGLAVNLDRPEESAVETAPPARPTTPATPIPRSAVTEGQGGGPSRSAVSSGPPPGAEAGGLRERSSPEPAKPHATPETTAETQPPAAKAPARPQVPDFYQGLKLGWSRPLHGLTVAAQVRAVSAKQRLLVVAVRNKLAHPVRVLPGHPELLIQTVGDAGGALQVERPGVLKTESTSADGMIGPGETARYALHYEAPILGARQRLCVAVGQTNAADEPVLVELTAGMR